MAGNMNIGAGLKLDGEKQFKDAIKGINKDLSVLGSEMKKVTAQFDGNANSIEALTAKQKVYNDRADEQRKKIDVITTALENAKKEYGENSDQVKNWQIKLNNAEADLAKTEKTLNETTEQMENFGKESKDGGSTIEKAGKQAGDSEGRFAKLGGVLKGLAIGMGTVAVAAGAVALKLGKEVIKAFGELEQNLGGSEEVFGKYANSIQKTGEDAYKNLGVSQSNYLATANKMGALFQGSGITQQKSLELTEKAMQRAADMASVMGIDMSVAMESVTGAAKGNYTMMDNLGVKMTDTSVKAFAVANGFEGVWAQASEAEKAQYAMQMFFDSTSQYAGNFARESTETVTGSLGLMKAATSSWVAGLGNANADMTNLTGNMVDAFKSVAKNIVPVLENIVKALPAATGAILAAIGDLLPLLLGTVTEIFSQVLETLLNLLPELIPAAVDAVMTIVGAIINNLPLLISAAVQLMAALVSGIGAALPQLIPAAVQAIITIVQGLIENLPMLLDAALQLVMGLARGIIDAIPVLIEALPALILSIVDFIRGAIPQIIETGIQLLVALVEALPEIIQKIVQPLPKIINGIITALMDNLPLIIDAGIKLFIALIENLPLIIVEIVKAIPQIIKALVEGFGQFFSTMGEIGLNLIKGLWQGISDAGAWLWNKISGFFGNVVSKIKNFFGIHSPSTVFAGFGKNMALGLGEGFSYEMRRVSRDMINAVPTDFDADFDASAGGQYGTRTITNSPTYNFYSPKALSMREMRIEMLATQQRQALAGV